MGRKPKGADKMVMVQFYAPPECAKAYPVAAKASGAPSMSHWIRLACDARMEEEAKQRARKARKAAAP